MIADIPMEPMPEVYLQRECVAVYQQYIHPADVSIKGIEISKRKALEHKQAKSGGTDGDDDILDQGNNASSDAQVKKKPDNTKDQGDLTMYQPGVIRLNAIKQQGLMLGAQTGYKWRYEIINKTLKKFENELSSIYDFSPFVTKEGVLYPVVERGDNSVRLSEDGKAARYSRVSWKIAEPARVVSTPPNWREWLSVQPVVSIDAISEIMMPFDKSEEKAWKDAICEGFKLGNQQARLDFFDKLNDLTHDYSGMLRFSYLVKRNMVSEPQIIHGDLGVTYENNKKVVNVGDGFIVIKQDAKFTDWKNWKPDFQSR